jgi:hypothetical protein
MGWPGKLLAPSQTITYVKLRHMVDVEARICIQESTQPYHNLGIEDLNI